MKRSLQCAVGAAAFLFSSGAWAQNFGTRGEFAISAERLFGFVHSSNTTTVNNVDRTTKYDTFSLLSNPLGGLFSVYGAARIGADYFVTDGFSVGLALGYDHVGTSAPNSPDSSLSVFTFAPRAGYAYMFSDVVGIWPRGGITYMSLSSSNDGVANSDLGGHQLALTLEAPLVIAPVPHAAFTIGPTFDIGLDGSSDTTVGNVKVSTDTTQTAIGVQAGMLIYL